MDPSTSRARSSQLTCSGTPAYVRRALGAAALHALVGCAAPTTPPARPAEPVESCQAISDQERWGFVVSDPRDHEELASALRSLEDVGLRQRMGRRSREIAERYSLSNQLARYERIYEEVAAGSHTG